MVDPASPQSPSFMSSPPSLQHHPVHPASLPKTTARKRLVRGMATHPQQYGL
jgi:hypothetical protein